MMSPIGSGMEKQQQCQSGAKLIANERINRENNNNSHYHYSWQKLNSIFLHGNEEAWQRGEEVESGYWLQHEIAFASSMILAVVVVVVALLNSVGNNTFLTPNSIAWSGKGFSGRTFPLERERERGGRGVCREPDVSAFRAVFMRHAPLSPQGLVFRGARIYRKWNRDQEWGTLKRNLRRGEIFF